MSFDIAKYPTLALVDSTQELRLLPKDSLPKLCDELRRYLLDSVSRSSGHFASGLGTVELTVALHYVYNTPFDRLIWDVGHQAYVGSHWRMLLEPGHQMLHDFSPQPFSLMRRIDGNIDDLEVKRAIANDAPHADNQPGMLHVYAVAAAG